MANILIVSQQSLMSNTTFRQDKNLLEMCDTLKENNIIKILYLHKSLGIEEENIKNDNKDINIEQVCIYDLIKKSLLKRFLVEFLEKNKIESIVFMSYHMAKLIMPYIEDIIHKFNIICDFRFSRLSYILQQNQMEKEKAYGRYSRIYKMFKIVFLQSIAVFKNLDYIILDEDCDLELLHKENIKNIISINTINDYINKKIKTNLVVDSSEILQISINKTNFKPEKSIRNKGNNEYVVDEYKGSSLIDDINKIIHENKFKFVCIFNIKMNIPKKSINLLAKCLEFNDKLAMCSPLTVYSEDRSFFKEQFENQRNNNFANWEEASPLLFSNCIVFKREIFNKVGFFDNRFKTFEYALYDFILRLYQINAYYCVMKDISIFKYTNIKQQLSLFTKDKIYLCDKWGEDSFSMGI